MSSTDPESEPPDAMPGKPELEGLDAATLMAEVSKPVSSGAATPPGAWQPPLPEELADLMPGYQILALLGRGGMGAVYRGVQLSLQREVAIKLLPPELGADPEFETRFKREARAMARLNHPNIVQIYDFGQTTAGHHYYVMEFVEGTDMHRLIRAGELTPEGALNAVSQICDALEYAHDAGFVHRDIKPANIFINQKGTLKVGDFGLAKLVGVEGDDVAKAMDQLGLTMTGVAMGTPHYIAPEQMEEGSSVDRRADIYSLGVMFYEMLTGEIPRGAVREPSKKIPLLDVRIDGVVFKAMESDREDRYQSATDLRTDVDGIRMTPGQGVAGNMGEAVAADAVGERESKSGTKPPHSHSRKPKGGEKSKMGLVTAMVVLLLALVGSAWFFLNQRAGDSRASADGDLAKSSAGILPASGEGSVKDAEKAKNSPDPAAAAAPAEPAGTTGKAQSAESGTAPDESDWKAGFVNQIKGRTFYRSTNSVNNVTFADDGKSLLMRTVEGREISYPIKLVSDKKWILEFRTDSKREAEFDESFSSFVLGDGTLWTAEKGPSFATKLEEAVHHVAGTEWEIEPLARSSENLHRIKFSEQLENFQLASGPRYGLTYDGQDYKFLFKWISSDGENWLEFDITFQSGKFFDSNKGGKPVRMVRVSPQAEGQTKLEAPASRPSGSLHAFGSVLIEGKSVPMSVGKPYQDKQYISCTTTYDGWVALRSDGNADFGWRDFIPSAKLKDQKFVSLPSAKAALLQNGDVIPYSDHPSLSVRYDELKKVKMFDANFRYAVAVFEDGSSRILNFKVDESETVFQPTAKDTGRVVAVSASNMGVSFLRQDGSVYCVDMNGPRRTGVESEKFAEIDSITNGFIGLTPDGRIFSWGDGERLTIPENLPKAVAIRGGGRMAALQKEDRAWMAFGSEPEWKEAAKVAEIIAGLKNPIDLDLYCNDKEAANLVWIEKSSANPVAEALTGKMPVPLPATDPITTRLAAIDAAFRVRHDAEIAKPHADAVAKLDGQISPALQREQDAASAAGDLDAVLQWQRAVERLTGGKGVPTPEEIAAENPPVERPEKLLAFYQTYREQLAKLEANRDEKAKPLLAIRDQEMEKFQRELTQAKDIEAALRVKAARDTPPSGGAPTSGNAGSSGKVSGSAEKVDAAPPSEGGVLKALGQLMFTTDPVDMSNAEGVDDFVEIDVSHVGWIARRANGDVHFQFQAGTNNSQGIINSKPAVNVKATEGKDIYAIFKDGSAVHLKGDANVVSLPLQNVADLDSPAYGPILALHRDGSASFSGKRFDENKAAFPPAEELTDVQAISCERYGAFILFKDGRLRAWHLPQPGKGEIEELEVERSISKGGTAIAAGSTRAQLNVVMGRKGIYHWRGTEHPFSIRDCVDLRVGGGASLFKNSRGEWLLPEEGAAEYLEMVRQVLPSRDLIDIDVHSYDNSDGNRSRVVMWIEKKK